MEVYLVLGNTWNSEILGVFSSEEKASQWLKNAAGHLDHSVCIVPWPVDAE